MESPTDRRNASRSSRGWSGVAVGALLASLSLPAAARPPSLEQLRTLSIEELINVEVTSVSKKGQPVQDAPAAVYVITGDDIRRSGAVSLPEVLRLAPNLQVARVNAANYAISARGFNSNEAANKLLVMVDNRSIYTPLHGGVLWDQPVMLDDIERIEVVSGPGGTLWGANAVNGVINVITKSSRDTQGGAARVQLGTVDQRASARFGGRIGDNASYRLYAQGFHFGNSRRFDGASAHDEWDGAQAGFRMDWAKGADSVTLQGDIFRNSFLQEGKSRGGNILTRWDHEFADDSALQIQAFFDRAERPLPGIRDMLQTYDIDGQYDFKLGESHAFILGGGFRHYKARFSNASVFVLDPEAGTVDLGNFFVQDSISLSDDLTLILGSKFEHSSFSGFEYLPNARLAWQASDRVLLWGAVSRAVRTPTRIDRLLVSPGLLDQATDFDSEKLTAYEIGYRGQPTEHLSLSLSLYYHDYSGLRGLSLTEAGRLRFDNVANGHSYGLEFWGDLMLTDWWRIHAGFNLLRKDYELQPPGLPVALDQHLGNDPRHQIFFRSQMNFARNLEFDFGLRYIDELPDPEVPDYVAADLRLGWLVADNLEFSLAASNIFGRHGETRAELIRFDPRRNLQLGMNWQF